MSEWHEVRSEDIDIHREVKEVNLRVTCNDWGNVYATLTFDQIMDICKEIDAPKEQKE